MKRAIMFAGTLVLGMSISSLAMQHEHMEGSPAQASQQKVEKKVKDPVCGMKITTKSAAGKSSYKGKTYHFCTKEDKEKFDKEPAKYAK
jgi:YHS domain-containing protein